MLRAWRIVKAKHAATAFDGEGAWLFGGRWNSVGVRVIYTSSSKSLAALETLVHLQLPVTFRYVSICVRFNKSCVETLPAASLQEGWNAEPPSLVSQAVGDEWVKSARSAVLAVPSVLTGDTNFLINPAHPDYSRIERETAEAFTFDPRLLT